ncbi:uncharacterized protein LOC128385666 [Panonychus citri]|uniref:uncharacterized protein LOC128385666 n=1 Tax=Panonychus citri TaxID=50023 RepID=UPI002307F062|nr:uncharacterized protein LOC128385666 [Panonychus citri]
MIRIFFLSIGKRSRKSTKSPKTIKPKRKQLTDDEIKRKIVKSIGLTISDQDEENLVIHLIEVVHSSCGLKITESPFNSHKDCMLRYIREVFNINQKEFKQLERSVLNRKNKNFTPSVRCWIKRAHDLPSTSANDSVNPYFIAYLLNPSVLPPTPRSPSTYTTKFVKSKVIKNQHNPSWNSQVIVPVKADLVTSNRGVIVDIWDSKSASLISAIKSLKQSRSSTNCFYGWRDLLSVINYKLGSKLSTVDLKIGSTSLPLNTISAIETPVSTNLIDSSGYPVGRIDLIMVWGSTRFADPIDKLSMIPIHCKIIRHLITWHCHSLIFKCKGKSSELPYSSIDFHSLFYIPASTLLNQHRIQINIGYWDNVLLCHCVAGDMLIEQIKLLIQANQPRSADEIFFRSLLISLLCSIDSSDPKRNYENYFSLQLREINFSLADEIFDLYRSIIAPMLTNLIEKHKDYANYHEVIQLLRLFARYERLYINHGFRYKFNQLLSSVVLAYFNQNVGSYVSWSVLIIALENFQETITRHWCQSIASIIGSCGQIKVQRLFNRSAVRVIEDVISEWRKEPKKNHLRMLNVYFFVRRLDLLFGGCLIEEINEGTNIPFSPDYVRRIEIEGPKKIKEKSKSSTGEIPLLRNSLFTILINSLGKTGKSKQVDQLFDDDEMSLLLPSSIAAITCQAINQIQVKSFAQVTISPRDLRLGQDFRFRDHCLGLGLLKVFPNNLKDKWFEMMKIQAQEIVDKSINDELSRDLEKHGTKVGNQLNRFFYDTLACTIYFFVTLEDWCEESMDKSIRLLFNSIDSFASKLTSSSLANVLSSSSEQLNTFRLIRTINGLSILRCRYLQKLLIEILTDRKSEEVWNCYWTFFDLETVTFDDKIQPETELINKLSAKNLDRVVVQRLMATLVIIESICFDINRHEDLLIDKVSEIFLKHHLSMTREVIESADREPSSQHDQHDYQELINTFHDDSVRIISLLNSDDVKFNLLLDMRHKLMIWLPIMIRSLSEAYEREKKSNKGQSVVTRVQIIKLSIIGEEFLSKLGELARSMKSQKKNSISSLLSKLSFSLDLTSIASSVLGEKLDKSKIPSSLLERSDSSGKRSQSKGRLRR